MEFSWSETEQRFRERIATFIEKTLPADWSQIAPLSPGSPEITDFSCVLCPKLAEVGLLVPHWPAEFGGSDASVWEHFILGEMMWEIGEPRGPQYYNVNWLGPTIMRYGSDEQKAYHLARMRDGDVIWCQGFSEPSGGSDLSSIRTRADWRGDRYVVNGQKIWTSYARLAEFCILLARTGPAARQLSLFLLPMNRPGITVRPIDSVVGDGDLHEVFFDDVEILGSERLGAEHEGLKIAHFALNFERVGIPRYALGLRTLQRAVGWLIDRDAFTPLARAAAAGAYASCEAARMLAYEVVDKRTRNEPPTGASSMARYALVTAENLVANFVLDWTPQLFVSADMPLVGTHHKRAIAAGIASGAAEIQLNLIARDLLGPESKRGL